MSQGFKIHHRSIFPTDKVAEHYSEKDGVPVKYVCTTALGNEAYAGDVFYRETPHPEFGNRYFRLYENPVDIMLGRSLLIQNADKVEELTFECIDSIGGWLYSRHRHDFVNGNGASIDGGRAYTRIIGGPVETKTFKVKDGEFVECGS